MRSPWGHALYRAGRVPASPTRDVVRRFWHQRSRARRCDAGHSADRVDTKLGHLVRAAWSMVFRSTPSRSMATTTICDGVGASSHFRRPGAKASHAIPGPMKASQPPALVRPPRRGAVKRASARCRANLPRQERSGRKVATSDDGKCKIGRRCGPAFRTGCLQRTRLARS